MNLPPKKPAAMAQITTHTFAIRKVDGPHRDRKITKFDTRIDSEAIRHVASIGSKTLFILVVLACGAGYSLYDETWTTQV